MQEDVDYISKTINEPLTGKLQVCTSVVHRVHSNRLLTLARCPHLYLILLFQYSCLLLLLVDDSSMVPSQVEILATEALCLAYRSQTTSSFFFLQHTY